MDDEVKDFKEEEGVKMDLIKLKGVFFFVAVALMIHLFSAEAGAQKRIGVLIYSEEVRYIESHKGIMDQLKKDGFGEPAVKFTIENSVGSKARAVEVVRKFAAAKMDLIFTIGTTAATVAAREIKDVPIVFSAVYDPIEAEIAKDWKSSGNNTTGATTRIPMSKLVNTLKEVEPVKRLAVLYTPGEKNTELQLKELQGVQTDSQIKVIPIILAKKEEAVQTLSVVVRTVGAIYLTGSSIIGVAVPIIVDMANKEKVLTMTHLDDLVDKGVLLGVCTNSYFVGRLAGEKAVKILKGAKPSSIPIESGKQLDYILNKKSAKAGAFQIPSSFMNKVSKIVE